MKLPTLPLISLNGSGYLETSYQKWAVYMQQTLVTGIMLVTFNQKSINYSIKLKYTHLLWNNSCTVRALTNI